jgi:large subunit ribosomal protein L17
MLHERIETTEAKGKELRSIADKMISLGIQGDLASRRRAAAYLLDPKGVVRLFSVIAPLFKGQDGSPVRQGGYTRLIKTRIRYGDAAPMVIVELTERTKMEAAETLETKAVPKVIDVKAVPTETVAAS